MTGMFTKATKHQLKGRLALDGPTGAGKTWTALEWATVLGKRVALIDTERGSASLYSHRFEFDTLDIQPPYEPGRLIDALKAAEAEGYDVVVVDSLSHFWEGEGGVLDIVDGAAQRAQGNSFAGWKVGTPALRHLVDTLLGLDAHLIVTMRSKMEYILETNDRGKQVPKKVGMAPVMRQGVEYEFTLIGDLDLDHRIVISKSRCDVLADQVIQPGRAGEAAETFKKWLDAGEPMASRNDTDALKQRMNQLPDERRKECKAAFVARFGNPDHLTAAQVPVAQDFVATFELDPQPDPDDRGPSSDEPPAHDDEEVSSPAGDDPSPTDAPASPAATITTDHAKQLHIAAGHTAKNLGHTTPSGKSGDSKWADPLLDALVVACTKGRTESTKELTSAEAGAVNGYLLDLEHGRATAEVTSGGDVTLTVAGRVYRFIRTNVGGMRHVPVQAVAS